MDLLEQLVRDLGMPPAVGPAHGLLVGLPLALLMLAALSELLKSDALGWRPGSLARVALTLGALACLPAVLTGATLALDGELAGADLDRHRCAGLSLTALAWLCLLACGLARSGARPRLTGAYRVLLVSAGVLAGVQLWWGAALAHGTERFAEAQRSPAPLELAPAASSPVEPAAPLATPEGDARQAIADCLDTLVAAGALAGPVAQDGPAVEVDLSRLGERADDSLLAGLAPLAPVLIWLDLAGTGISDDGLEALAGCVALQRLDLSDTAVGDAGLSRLEGLAQLTVLNLHGSAVTDAGLGQLARLPALRRVYLWNTAVSDDGAAALAAARPGLTIDRGASLPADRESGD